MGTHVFVDETKKDGYLIIAALVRTEHLAASRRMMRSLLLPNQRRIHFKDERPARKLRILAAIEDTGAVGLAFRAAPHTPELDARAECLRRMVDHLADHGATRLVLERDDSLVSHDRRVLYEATVKTGDLSRLDISTREHTKNVCSGSPTPGHGVGRIAARGRTVSATS